MTSVVRNVEGKEVPVYSCAELIKNVVQWSTDRGIIENGVWYTQGTKLFEESGEAATGVAKGRNYLIADAVGDGLVVLVNILALTKSEKAMGSLPTYLEESCAAAKTQYGQLPKEDFPKYFQHYLVNKLMVGMCDLQAPLWDAILENKPIPEIEDNEKFRHLLGAFSSLAWWSGMGVKEAFSLAWDEIKDRKGRLSADGIFIKESDAVTVKF